MARYSRATGVFIVVVLLLPPSFCLAQLFPLVPVEELGLRVASGFRVTLYADEKLGNDIFAMTLDAQGHVVVTGPGYIRTLHDTNGDVVGGQSDFVRAKEDRRHGISRLLRFSFTGWSFFGAWNFDHRQRRILICDNSLLFACASQVSRIKFSAWRTRISSISICTPSTLCSMVPAVWIG
jgi:hypothetical protein